MNSAANVLRAWRGVATSVWRPSVAVVGTLLLGSATLMGPAQAGPAQTCDVPASAMPLHIVESSLLDAINAYRRERGLNEVHLSPSLRRAALWKSRDRMRGGPNNHNDADRTWDQRLSNCGYTVAVDAGEALVLVQGDLPPNDERDLVLRAWQESPAHDQILTDPAFHAIGLGRAHDRMTKRTYWTADFGGEIDVAKGGPSGQP